MNHCDYGSCILRLLGSSSAIRVNITNFFPKNNHNRNRQLKYEGKDTSLITY